jgi:pyruvate,water dikinase
VGRGDVARVGGKNASLGEMVRNLAKHGVRVPPGFATTARAYWGFVEANGLRETITSALDDFTKGEVNLAESGSVIRRAFLRGSWPKDLSHAIADHVVVDRESGGEG